MPTLIITVGVSGSGKSTWISSFIDKNSNYVVVSTDGIRKEISGDISDQSHNYRVWLLAEKRVRKALKEKKNVILDSTMISETKRKTFLLSLSGVNFDYKFKIFKPLSKEELANRIKKDIESGKDRAKVPLEVIEKQLELFNKDVRKIDKKKILEHARRNRKVIKVVEIDSVEKNL